jgi:hypothetical protein
MQIFFPNFFLKMQKNWTQFYNKRAQGIKKSVFHPLTFILIPHSHQMHYAAAAMSQWEESSLSETEISLWFVA